MTRRNDAVRGLLALASMALLAGCHSGNDSSNSGGGTSTGGGGTQAASGNAAQLTGAGATFPAPIYAQWFQEYGQKNGVQINYQAIGSGGGIKAITGKTVDFGASDAPMTDDEMKHAAGIVHIPTVAGAVVVGYNLPGVHLKLTGPVIANIFLGKIKTWNDPQIAAVNAGASLPATPIVAAHRSDGSGTTNIFTTYLSQVSPDWKAGPGAGKSVQWPGGSLGGSKNDGVAQLVQRQAGGIGYLELAYALKNKIAYADVQNKAGKFITPSVDSATAAVAGVTLPDDFRAVPVNTTAPDGYPITGFTFLLVYPDVKPQFKDFLKWALTDGQKEVGKLSYAALPDSVQKKALAKIDTLK